MNEIETLNRLMCHLTTIFSENDIAEVVLSPGSRSAPIALAFLRNSSFKCHVKVDERSAAYFALGRAKATGLPVVLVCTSGTALLNYAPAVAEAFFQRIPLLICSADRPEEWIGQADNQAIFQQNIFGKHCKAFYQMPEDLQNKDSEWLFVRQITEAVSSVFHASQGPVHLNFPIREPFYSEPYPFIKPSKSVVRTTKMLQQIDSASMFSLAELIHSASKIWMVIGMGVEAEISALFDDFSSRTDALVVADPLSNVHTSRMIGAGSKLLISSVEPDLVLSFGIHFLSSEFKTLMRSLSGVKHIHIDRSDVLIDTFQTVSHWINSEAGPFLEQMLPLLNQKQEENAFNELSEKWKKPLEQTVGGIEQQFVAEIVRKLPSDSVLHFGNSSPVRYIFGIHHTIVQKKIAVYANRGTSGIDGCLSSAVGMAYKSKQFQCLIIGDLSLRYDQNGFWNAELPENFIVFVLNNQGGGIFRHLAGPAKQPELENYFASQQNHRFHHIAADHGLRYTLIHELEELQSIAFTGQQLIEIAVK